MRIFATLRRDPSPVLIGAIGQLALLPFIALAIVNAIALHPTIVSGLLILSLCPGGGISNTYSYLARCNVLLSAMIATIGTLVSLVTIPLWLRVLPSMPGAHELHAVPASTIILQLLAFMVLPLGLGILARYRTGLLIERIAPSLRTISTALILVILMAALATVGQDLATFAAEIATTATLFIMSAMLLGALLGFRSQPPRRSRPSHRKRREERRRCPHSLWRNPDRSGFCSVRQLSHRLFCDRNLDHADVRQIASIANFYAQTMTGDLDPPPPADRHRYLPCSGPDIIPATI